jgi:spore maturation protein CgeB
MTQQTAQEQIIPLPALGGKKGVDSILLVGGFMPDRAEASFERGFHAIGVTTHRLNTNHLGHTIHPLVANRIGYRLTMGSLSAREVASREFNRALEQSVIDSGVRAVLLLKGEFVMPETVARLRQRGVRVALFFPDNPFPPHQQSRPETLPTARAVDLYLVWSERLVDKLREAGAGNPAFLPFAWDPEVFPYCEEQPQGVWPGALFLGGWDQEREEFLEEIASRVEIRIFGPREWGTRTRSRSRVRRSWQGRDLRMAEAARAVRESAVCLNLLRRQHMVDGEPDGLIMRHFEVPGAGGALLSTRGSGATRLFPEGDSGEYFTGMDECADKVKKLIAHPAERRRLVARAHAEVAARHRYAHRACEILRLLELCS